MKKSAILMLITLVALIGMGSQRSALAQSASADSFTITITVGYISMGLFRYNNADYTTWAIGAVAPSKVSTMDADSGGALEKGILVSNESNVAVDLASFSTNTAAWALVTGTPAQNQYKLEAKAFTGWETSPYPDMSSGAVAINTTVSPGTDIATGISAGADRYMYYRLTAPSSVTTGASNTITVTVEASGS